MTMGLGWLLEARKSKTREKLIPINFLLLPYRATWDLMPLRNTIVAPWYILLIINTHLLRPMTIFFFNIFGYAMWRLISLYAVRAKLPMGCSVLGSSVQGILQARILEWVAMLSSRGSPNPGIEPVALMSPALAGGFFRTSTTWETLSVPWPWVRSMPLALEAPHFSHWTSREVLTN